MRKVLCSMIVAAAALCLCVNPALAWGPMRMTGGGSIIIPSGPFAGTRITHGFELHCIPAEGPSENLEINYITPDGAEHHWHLDTLTRVACWSDHLSPAPPPSTAGLDDVYNGCGNGTFDGTPGVHICWYFTDHGEPGVNDTAGYIGLPGLPSIVGSTAPPVVSGFGYVGLPLTFGNHQVHPELP